MRVGMGYDVHKLITGRPLILGGIHIPFEKGLLGHSDADVLVHAACDALLGAAGLGDIGLHFPDSSPDYKDIYSIELLRLVYRMLRDRGYGLVNLDATILAQEPKLAPYRQHMQQTMAQVLATNPQIINIKATTTEGLGMVGAGEGMAALCIALIQ